mgnify:CR=1 FL=1
MAILRLKKIPRAWAGNLDQVGFEAGSVSLPSIAKHDDPDTGPYFSAANTFDIAAGGVRSFQFQTLASGVNYLVSYPATAAASVTTGARLAAEGASANVSLQLVPKGTAQVIVGAGVVGTPALAPTGDPNTGPYFSAADTFDVAAGGIRAFSVNTLASGVNYVYVTPATAAAATSAGAIVGAAGTSANVALQLAPKGTGQVILPVGAVGTPAASFLGDLNSGVYWIGADEFGFAANGVLQASITASGILFPTGKALQAGVTATNTLLLQAYDVDGTAYDSLITMTSANEPTLLLAADGGVTVTQQLRTGAGNGAVGAGVTAVEFGDGTIHQTVLTLTLSGANDLDIADGADNGASAAIYTFPAGRILILGVTCDLSSTVNNVFEATPNDVFDIGIGTVAAAADATLAGTEQDLVPKQTNDTASNVTLTHVYDSALAASAQFDGTSAAIVARLNVAVANASISAALTIAVTGTVTISWVNLGDY